MGIQVERHIISDIPLKHHIDEGLEGTLLKIDAIMKARDVVTRYGRYTELTEAQQDLAILTMNTEELYEESNYTDESEEPD